MATRPTLYPEHATTNVPLPVNGGDNKIRPDSTIREVGWDQGQKPTAPEFNWQLNNIYDWIVWLDQEEQDLPNNYYNKTELNGGQLDTRYYTETELNAGQLDNRYYTETEINTNHYTKTAADTKFADVAGDTFTGAVTFSAAVSASVAPSADTHVVRKVDISANTFESSEQSIVAGEVSVSHGLGARPELFFTYLRCTTADLGYSIGDEVMVATSVGDTGTSNGTSNFGVGTGFTPFANATVVGTSVGNSVLLINNKSSGGISQITTASWRLVFRAKKDFF